MLLLYFGPYRITSLKYIASKMVICGLIIFNPYVVIIFLALQDYFLEVYSFMNGDFYTTSWS
jgi:hypothetical protein